jgi:hypothetical protein
LIKWAAGFAARFITQQAAEKQNPFVTPAQAGVQKSQE